MSQPSEHQQTVTAETPEPRVPLAFLYNVPPANVDLTGVDSVVVQYEYFGAQAAGHLAAIEAQGATPYAYLNTILIEGDSDKRYYTDYAAGEAFDPASIQSQPFYLAPNPGYPGSSVMDIGDPAARAIIVAKAQELVAMGGGQANVFLDDIGPWQFMEIITTDPAAAQRVLANPASDPAVREAILDFQNGGGDEEAIVNAYTGAYRQLIGEIMATPGVGQVVINNGQALGAEMLDELGGPERIGLVKEFSEPEPGNDYFEWDVEGLAELVEAGYFATFIADPSAAGGIDYLLEGRVGELLATPGLNLSVYRTAGTDAYETIDPSNLRDHETLTNGPGMPAPAGPEGVAALSAPLPESVAALVGDITAGAEQFVREAGQQGYAATVSAETARLVDEQAVTGGRNLV